MKTGRDEKSLADSNPTPFGAQVQPKSRNCLFIHCRIPRAANCRSSALVRTRTLAFWRVWFPSCSRQLRGLARRVWKFAGLELNPWVSGEWTAYRQYTKVTDVTPMYTVRSGFHAVVSWFRALDENGSCIEILISEISTPKKERCLHW